VINPAMRGVGILLGIPEAKFPCDFPLVCGKQYSDHDRAVVQSFVAAQVSWLTLLRWLGLPSRAGFTQQLTSCSAPVNSKRFG